MVERAPSPPDEPRVSKTLAGSCARALFAAELARQLVDDSQVELALGAVGPALDAIDKAQPGFTPSVEMWGLAARTVASGEVTADALRWVDLALVDGFRRGHAGCVEVVMGPVVEIGRAALTGAGATPSEAEDLIQDRLARLLGPLEQIGYGGRGALAAWFRRCVTRDLVSHQRRARLMPAVSRGSLLRSPLLATEPELAPARIYSKQLEESLSVALSALDAADRRLLRLIYVDGLSAQQAGAALGGLHRVSVQRRLAAARAELKANTLMTLKERFGLDPVEAESMLRSLVGWYAPTLSELLGA